MKQNLKLNMMKKIFYFAIFAIVIAGCKKDDDNNTPPVNTGSGPEEIVYVQTNDQSGNAILAYRHTGNGTLTQIAGSPFPTGGTGVANPTQKLGPDDSDYEVFLTSDNKYLYAVNGGSNNISVFNVAGNGTLSPVAGSPFPSGGETPASVFVSGNFVYVVNKSDNPAVTPVQAPNYTTFVFNNGALEEVPGSKVETSPGSSPAQALLSHDRKFLFGADFLGFTLAPPVGTLRSFTVDSAGKLMVVAGTPLTIPDIGGALGLWQHPAANILYVGFPLGGKIGVYNINPTSGMLTYQTSVVSGPAACWLRTNELGTRLYCLNSAASTVTVFNNVIPNAPVLMQTDTLKITGPTYSAMGMTFTTSEPFAFALSPAQKYIYIVSQHTNPDFSIGNYNYMHVLFIDVNGRVYEPGDPIQIPVAANVRPKGVAVLKIQ